MTCPACGQAERQDGHGSGVNCIDPACCTIQVYTSVNRGPPECDAPPYNPEALRSLVERSRMREGSVHMM